jgi:hypothetical protein
MHVQGLVCLGSACTFVLTPNVAYMYMYVYVLSMHASFINFVDKLVR